MRVLKILLILVTVVITSCYFFPFVLAAFPIANSKMILAAVGLLLLGISLVKKENAVVDHDFFTLSLWALCVSLISYLSMTFNDTADDEFTQYFVSMWVWLGGAYAVVMIIRRVHGAVSVPLVINYLLAVCVMQCILALVFDNSPDASRWAARTFAGEGFMGNTDDRMHGIGCSLDVAGFRFASVIFMAAFMVVYSYATISKKADFVYLAAICVISVVGNMISRSTVIGTVIGIGFIIIHATLLKPDTKIITMLAAIIVTAIVVCVFFYNADATFRANIRFGFEGFFSIAEKGEWQTNSNDILQNMVVWPDNVKTWIIGDGYINNPLDKSLETFDPYYTGPSYGGYYKGTDIGYLRYIFYFGIIGLSVFSMFFIYACRICMRKFEAFRWMFAIILVINFIQWIKVSTDLFVVFALFICIPPEENDDYMRRRMVCETQK